MESSRPKAVEVLNRDLDPDNLLAARRRAVGMARRAIDHRRAELARLNQIDRSLPRPVV
jgi:hypothetical protein